MLAVTDAAKRQLAQVSAQRGLSPAQCLRLTIPPKWTGEGEFGVVIDAPSPGDLVVAHGAEPVLRVEPEVAERLAQATLDFKETPMGMAFALDIY
ncbi:MAG: hypothetical protein J4F32_01810 [Dehalococcoidia bacterium]|nr:hypothetical protein [Dehalococcoidia bacterium]